MASGPGTMVESERRFCLVLSWQSRRSAEGHSGSFSALVVPQKWIPGMCLFMKRHLWPKHQHLEVLHHLAPSHHVNACELSLCLAERDSEVRTILLLQLRPRFSSAWKDDHWSFWESNHLAIYEGAIVFFWFLKQIVGWKADALEECIFW